MHEQGWYWFGWGAAAVLWLYGAAVVAVAAACRFLGTPGVDERGSHILACACALLGILAMALGRGY